MDATSGYKYCPRIGRVVATALTEGQCRDVNRCGDVFCPLESELGQRKVSRAFELLASSFVLRLHGQERNGGR
jgi:hypothetical protein